MRVASPLPTVVRSPLVSFDDWVLVLHVLSAFAFFTAIVLFWILIVAVRKTDEPEARVRIESVVQVGNATFAIGSVGTIVFGLWLAFSVGGYDIWDGWIVAALVLWVLALPVGRRTGDAYMPGANKARELQSAGRSGPSDELLALNRTSEGVLMHFLTSIVVLLILIDMIWKPGA
jgi:uncharacterized membrane protein